MVKGRPSNGNAIGFALISRPRARPGEAAYHPYTGSRGGHDPHHAGGGRPGRRRASCTASRKAGKSRAAAIGLGFYISFSGLVTFKNAKAIKEVATKVPLENMLVENRFRPYLAPVAVSWQNKSAGLRQTLWPKRSQDLKEFPSSTFCAQTTDNFNQLFNVIS
jgi:hypothetical protein